MRGRATGWRTPQRGCWWSHSRTPLGRAVPPRPALGRRASRQYRPCECQVARPVLGVYMRGYTHLSVHRQRSGHRRVPGVRGRRRYGAGRGRRSPRSLPLRTRRQGARSIQAEGTHDPTPWGDRRHDVVRGERWGLGPRLRFLPRGRWSPRRDRAPVARPVVPCSASREQVLAPYRSWSLQRSRVVVRSSRPFLRRLVGQATAGGNAPRGAGGPGRRQRGRAPRLWARHGFRGIGSRGRGAPLIRR